MPPPTLQVTLDPDVQAELERRYHTTRDATTRTRYQIVLLNAQGHTPPQIAQLVRSSADTVRRVLNRYLAGGADAVPHRPHPGQPPHYPPGWEQELVRVADLDPHEVGVDSALWTCRLLADYLHRVTGYRAGIESVRIALHRAGFVCKRPRWVLSRKAQAQPGWAKNAGGWRRCWPRPQQRCPHPPPIWSRMRPWPTTCFLRICPGCWACSSARTCTCKTRSRSPCTRPCPGS